MTGYQGVRDAAFELGRISAEHAITNRALLRRLADLLAEALAVDIAGLAVFENGIHAPATACYVRGPWKMDEAARFSEQSFWAVENRSLAQRLEGLRRGRIHHRAQPADHADRRARSASHRTEARSPLTPTRALEDQALVLFQRSDGAELLIGINTLDGSGALSHTVLAKAAALAPYIARCWAHSWKTEPQWMHALKPSTRAILDALIEGLDDEQIAARTGLSYHSVRAHLKRLFKEAGVRSRLHLMQQCRSLRASGTLVETPLDTPNAHNNTHNHTDSREPAVA